jgi:hypothetical protein
MGRERKATKKEGKEHNPISFRRHGNALITREDDRRCYWKEALLLGLIQIGLLKQRGNPLESHLVAPFIHHFLSKRNLLDGHSRVKNSGAARRKQAQGRRSNGGGGGIES